MNSSEDLNLTSFRIAYNDQLIEFNYNPSFEEYKTVTINSVIEKVLEKLGPHPLNTTSNNYSLICSCGKPFPSEQLLSKSKCNHYTIFNDLKNPSKNKNEKFLLIEKTKPKKEQNKNKNNELLSNYEISQILMQATGAKKIKTLKIVPESSIPNFPISDNLKAKIKELQEKKERGSKLSSNSFDIKYNEQYYQELLEMGIDSNKIKAALRITRNQKQEALLMATEQSFSVNSEQDYLYCDNSEVLTNNEFMKKCKEEVKKEYNNLYEAEITSRTKMVIKAVTKKNEFEESEEINESGEGYDSSDSDEDSFIDDFGDSGENSIFE